MSKKKKHMKEMKEEAVKPTEAQATEEQSTEQEENVQENVQENADDSQSADNAETTESEATASEEEKYQAALAEAEEKYNDLHDRYLRQVAEFENYRKRTLKEKSELILNGSANLMTAVLPVLDDMDRALDSMSKTDDAVACCEGFKLIARNFRNILEQNGLKQIDTEGQAFDTDFHEAIALMPASDESQKGQIVDCIQPGYKLNDKVLRHSKVVVAN